MWTSYGRSLFLNIQFAVYLWNNKVICTGVIGDDLIIDKNDGGRYLSSRVKLWVTVWFSHKKLKPEK